MSDSTASKFGLFVLNSTKGKGIPVRKSSSLLVRKSSVFDDDDEFDKMDSGSAKSKTSMNALHQKLEKKQTRIEIDKAINEDPTVYQYDEVYDEMETKKTQAHVSTERKSKYIGSLLKHAEIRNFEKERRLERKVQREREEEGDEFVDKESFVTPAYRKKMEEMQKGEEIERKREELESMLDVRKQRDMSGFYRHLYRQTMGEEKISAVPTVEKFAQKELRKSRPYRRNQTLSEKDESTSSSSSDNDDNEEDSICSEPEKKLEPAKPQALPNEVPQAEAIIDEKTEIKKLPIWQKRTVGPVFDAALKRYLLRIAER